MWVGLGVWSGVDGGEVEWPERQFLCCHSVWWLISLLVAMVCVLVLVAMACVLVAMVCG